jgi:hypothetical protein
MDHKGQFHVLWPQKHKTVMNIVSYINILQYNFELNSKFNTASNLQFKFQIFIKNLNLSN